MATAGVAIAAVEFPALGSTAVLAVVDAARLAPAREAVEETVQEFDLACSRFREDSELTAVNAADGCSVPVGEVLIDAVAAALRAASLTDGDVDPTVGEALLALGYDRDFDLLDAPQVGRSPAAGPASYPRRGFSIARVPGWRAVELDRERRTIRVPRGVKLDLGATAKALAADRAARRAHERTGCGVLVGLGGDLALAGQAPESGWRVRVTDDHRAGFDAPGQWITLRSGGLATSSTTVRVWRMGEREFHHLVDPASGLPARGVWRTASVAAASCLDANIASTAAIIRGEAAAPWLQSLGLPSRLVSVDGRVRHLAAWPTDGDDLDPVADELPAAPAAPAGGHA